MLGDGLWHDATFQRAAAGNDVDLAPAVASIKSIADDASRGDFAHKRWRRDFVV